MEQTSRGTSSSGAPPTPKNNILDESDVSRDLGDSHRSGGSDLIFPTGLSSAHHMHTEETKMQESKTIDESYREEDDDNDEGHEHEGGGNHQTGDIPFATPASTHDHEGESSRTNLSDRVRRDFVPPLPLTTGPHGGSFGGFAAAANHISPATPMHRPPVMGIASISAGGASMSMLSTPGSDSRAALLAGMYQSSRRSRNNTPGTGGSSASSIPMPPPASFPPPPPLYGIGTSTPSSDVPSNQLHHSGTDSSATTVPTQHLRGSLEGSITGDNNIHKVSLQSSTNTTAGSGSIRNLQQSTGGSSTMLHESWNTSMGSLMTGSFLNTSLGNVYNPRLSSASASGTSQQGMLSHRKSGSGGGVGAAALPVGGCPTGESSTRLIMSSMMMNRNSRRPNLMDYKIEDRTSNRRLSPEQSGSSSYSSGTSESISLREATVTEHKISRRGSNHRHPRLQLNLMDYKLEDSDHEDQDQEGEDQVEEGRKSPHATIPTVPTLSGESSTLSPVQQHKKAPPPLRGLDKTESTRCMEQMSKLQVRSSKRKGGSESSIEIEEEEDESCSAEAGGKKLGAHNQDDNAEGSQDTASYSSKGPPKKKNKSLLPPEALKKPEEHYLTPQTHKSTMSSASFEIIAHPSSRVSSIHTDVSPTDADMMELLKGNIDNDLHDKEIFEADAEEEDHAMGVVLRMKEEESRQEEEEEDRVESKAHPTEEVVQGPRREDEQMQQDDDYRADERKRQARDHRNETPTMKDQRILRRKIQRLLLIRHCSKCSIPPPPLVTVPVGPPNITFSSEQCIPCGGDETAIEKEAGEAAKQQQQSISNPPPPVATCPVTSHCAEGKALCAHIRTCKLTNCTYKKCLTSREVLGHYINCKDRACEICGPVRALDRSQSHHHNRRGGGGHAGEHHPRRRRSDSSIETIDDEGWLNENMMESFHYH